MSGEVSEPTYDEQFIFTELELLNGERLACCAHLQSDINIYVPISSLLTNSQLQVEGSLNEISTDPMIQSFTIEVSPPSLDDPRSDFKRIANVLAVDSVDSLSADPDVIALLSSMGRASGWQLTVYLRGSEIVGAAPIGSPALGMAIDLGTTKIAAYLLNLATGEELAAAGALNPQIGYGEDVISRLNYAQRHQQGTSILAQMLYDTLNELLIDLLRQAKQDALQVADCCIVGNSAMIHLLLQLPTNQLASAPFVAATSAALDVKARLMGLGIAPGAYIHILPGIGGFVGSDHVAMLLSSRMDDVDRVTIGIDIGTNTEVALTRPEKAYLASASCASGPAFEGAHVSDGMRAASGAIEAMRLTESDIKVKTIGDSPPIGLCGSGIVDSMAELRRWQLINERGRFQKGNGRLRQGRFGLELLLVSSSESGSNRDLVITQQDVNEIQLAKGAIRAGLDLLMQATKTEVNEVQEVIIAGAFGSFLNVESALDIGLLPYFPKATYRQVGNAAAVGAKWALISGSARARAKWIAAQTEYIELTTYPRFRRHFALGMLFPLDEQLRFKKV
jgi:uncharacterized 2Fe-2S/4Fe-4S cluster protein (DUF4445 family)